MNILISTHFFHPHIGGIESVAEEHAERLVARGHNVTVVSSDVSAETGFTQRHGYQIARYSAWNPGERFGLPYPIPNPISVRNIMGQIDLQEIDVIHVHGMNYLSSSAILLEFDQHTPVLLHQHTPFIDYPTPIKLAEILNDRVVGRWNLRQASQVLCVSEEIREYTSKIEPGLNSDVLVNGVDIEEYKPHVSTSTPFRSTGDNPVFFSLSRMSQKKGVDTLLEAGEILDRRSINAQIAIAGDGPMSDEVEAAAQSYSNLEYMGRISDRQVKECYSEADAFLFTSKSGEAFPTLTMMEAYASGTPVIASNLAEDAVGVNEGRNTILINPNNPDQLAEAIITCVEDPNMVSTMGRNARESAERHFAIESKIDQLEEYYLSAIAEEERKRSSN